MTTGTDKKCNGGGERKMSEFLTRIHFCTSSVVGDKSELEHH